MNDQQLKARNTRVINHLKHDDCEPTYVKANKKRKENGYDDRKRVA